MVRSPKLRALGLLGVTHRSPVTKGLKRKFVKFPTIHEMIATPMYPDFIRSCPNLESLTLKSGFGKNSSDALSSHGAGLKRIRGVDTFFDLGLECEFLKTPSDEVITQRVWIIAVVRDCPKLQDISLHCDRRVRPRPRSTCVAVGDRHRIAACPLKHAKDHDSSRLKVGFDLKRVGVGLAF